MTGRKCPDNPAPRVEGHGTRGRSVLPGCPSSPAPPRGLCLPLLDAEAAALWGGGKVSLEAEESAEVLALVQTPPRNLSRACLSVGVPKAWHHKGSWETPLGSEVARWSEPLVSVWDSSKVVYYLVGDKKLWYRHTIITLSFQVHQPSPVWPPSVSPAPTCDRDGKVTWEELGLALFEACVYFRLTQRFQTQ